MQRSSPSPLSPRPSWLITIASLLPLWLWSVAILAEGFPRPPISVETASLAGVLGVALSLVLLWKGGLTVELLLFSLFPFLLVAAFDEISTSYKTPFIFLCALILAAGALVYQRVHTTRLKRGLILLAVASATMVLASNATANFWEMATVLGYYRCFPDGYGCAPLTGQETPWWILFFSL